MSSDVGGLELKALFGHGAIESRIRDMGAEIDAAYGDAPLVAICVLKGAFMFFADLVRNIKNPNLELDFARLASYGMNSVSSKHVIFSKDIEVDILGKHVLIVEDIVDSGHTMLFLRDQLLARNPLSVDVASLVDKHERRETDVTVKFVGFHVPEGFLVGYGMDYAEHFRGLSGIYEILHLSN